MIKLETHRGATPFRRRFFFLKRNRAQGQGIYMGRLPELIFDNEGQQPIAWC